MATSVRGTQIVLVSASMSSRVAVHIVDDRRRKKQDELIVLVVYETERWKEKTGYGNEHQIQMDS